MIDEKLTYKLFCVSESQAMKGENQSSKRLNFQCVSIRFQFYKSEFFYLDTSLSFLSIVVERGPYFWNFTYGTAIQKVSFSISVLLGLRSSDLYHNSANFHSPLHPHHLGAVLAGTGKRKKSWTRAVFSHLQRKGLEKRFQVTKCCFS